MEGGVSMCEGQCMSSDSSTLQSLQQGCLVIFEVVPFDGFAVIATSRACTLAVSCLQECMQAVLYLE